MSSRRTFLTSLTALLVPAALWKRTDEPAAPAPEPAAPPRQNTGNAGDADFRRYLRQAARAQAGGVPTISDRG